MPGSHGLASPEGVREFVLVNKAISRGYVGFGEENQLTLMMSGRSPDPNRLNVRRNEGVATQAHIRPMTITSL